MFYIVIVPRQGWTHYVNRSFVRATHSLYAKQNIKKSLQIDGVSSKQTLLFAFEPALENG